MERESNSINFNFTPEQKERFKDIYNETKKLYPELISDDVSKQRIKVLIANNVINGDKPLRKEDGNNDCIVLDLDKKLSTDNISNGQEE